MAESIKEKADAAGHKIAEAATKVGHKVSEKVEEVKDWTKEKSHQVGNRIDELAQKAEHKVKETFGDSADRRTRRPIFANTWMSSARVATSSVGSTTYRETISSSPRTTARMASTISFPRAG